MKFTVETPQGSQFEIMILTVKTLQHSKFEIMVQPTNTGMTVKKNIEDMHGRDIYPCGQQLLFHKGKLLNDDSTLVESEVSEDSFLVLLLDKRRYVRPSETVRPSENMGIIEYMGPNENMVMSGTSSAQEYIFGAPCEVPASLDFQRNIPHNVGNVFLTLEDEEAIRRLEAMGFSRELAIHAFFECNHNEDLAFNYLLENQQYSRY